MDKNTIRAVMKKMRSELSKEAVENDSLLVCANLLEIDEIKKASVVMIYSDFSNEVKTAAMTAQLLFQGKTVCIPVVDGEDIFAADIKSKGFCQNKYGIGEPNGKTAIRINEDNIEVCIIPGLAFDECFGRLGFGKGCYDRFLSKTENCFKIGIAYDFQVVDKLPTEKHDIVLDMIITPKTILRRK